MGDGHVLAGSWLAAAARGEPAAAELERIYAGVMAEIGARRPVCRASGRCCNFEAHGHRLYVTGLEAAYALSRMPAGISLSAGSLAAARARGGCPFQAGNLCSIHTIKPLGCRAYFCDPTAQEWQESLSERMLARIRTLHDTHAIEYRYGEWREMLAAFLPHLPPPAPGAVQAHEHPPVRLTVDGSELP